VVAARSMLKSLELDAAEQLGILVITREVLEQAINFQTMLQTDPDRIYAEGEQQAVAALAKHR
jgi:hypothetical protein